MSYWGKRDKDGVVFDLIVEKILLILIVIRLFIVRICILMCDFKNISLKIFVRYLTKYFAILPQGMSKISDGKTPVPPSPH